MTNDATTPIVDLDAILAKRQETVGSRDRFPAAAYGQTWWVMDPKLADDEWLDDLEDLSDEGAGPIELAEHYLGAEQWKKFKEAGGRASDVLAIIDQYMEYQAALDDDEGKAGRSSRSSTRAQRRRRRR
ncbi:hypothetical protein [Rhodococcus pyridinivorans]|uniref:Tail assembly chaperone n=1 Tax=Rhodococcus pyridinivorans TaxID=103816 RepID=A0A7M2XP17_9NOCA|nr:hypothetical protein [Rhodococcus pyridinivorans]QOV99505.1 hypothetical protein INP59_03635 [Rhodococcus pyridinivorans]